MIINKKRVRAAIIAAILLVAVTAAFFNLKFEPADTIEVTDTAAGRETAAQSDSQSPSDPASAGTPTKHVSQSAGATESPLYSQTSGSNPTLSQSGIPNSHKPPSSPPAVTSRPASPTATPNDGKKYCTVSIVCHTVLNNMDNLRNGLAPYVPKNGVILAPTRVELLEDESAFEVLKKVTRQYKIQMEFRNDPLYSGAYIEGINHLYEYDCGADSGWMYKVNGWFPSYGCSRYILKDGDVMEWCYTCDLGRDVGDNYYD